MVNINYIYLLLIPPIVIQQHTIMLSILSLLSFVVIAASRNVTFKFELGTRTQSGMDMDTNDMMTSVDFIVLKPTTAATDHLIIYRGRFKL